MEFRSKSSLTLLTLPLEIRVMVLKELFSSITVFHSEAYDSIPDSPNSESNESPTLENVNSESNEDTASDRASINFSDGTASEHASVESFEFSWSQNTSILQTCRQLYNDAGPLLAPNILLEFSSTATMLDTLTTLPPSVIESLRHMRVMAEPFPLHRDNHISYTTFSMAHTLPMFPGLQLDVLTVEDCYHFSGCKNDQRAPWGTYNDIQSAVVADGWKELHYIIPTTEFMTSNQHERERIAQPAGWDEMLKKKDGETSDAEVRMYVADQKTVDGLAEGSYTRSLWKAVPGHLVPPPPSFEWDREVIVIAKRAAGAKYVQDSSRLHPHIRRLLDKMSWAELKTSEIYIPPGNDPWRHL